MEVGMFWMTSSEFETLHEVRRCTPVKRIRLERRKAPLLAALLRRLRYGKPDDLLLVEIDPPLIGQPYGLGARDLDQVVLATRHLGHSIFDTSDWPKYVHVARLLVELDGKDEVRHGELEVIGWASRVGSSTRKHLDSEVLKQVARCLAIGPPGFRRRLPNGALPCGRSTPVLLLGGRARRPSRATRVRA
jgi:hypothetical protein